MFIRSKNSYGLYGNIPAVGSPENPVVVAPGSDNIAEKAPAKNETQANGMTGGIPDIAILAAVAFAAFYLV